MKEYIDWNQCSYFQCPNLFHHVRTETKEVTFGKYGIKTVPKEVSQEFPCCRQKIFSIFRSLKFPSAVPEQCPFHLERLLMRTQ